jgi:hypothetical protein
VQRRREVSRARVEGDHDLAADGDVERLCALLGQAVDAGCGWCEGGDASDAAQRLLERAS